MKYYARVSQDLIDIRHDFFAKVDAMQRQIDAVGKALMELKGERTDINIDDW